MSQRSEFEQMHNESSTINAGSHEHSNQASQTNQEIGGQERQKIHPPIRKRRRWLVVILILILGLALFGAAGRLSSSIFGKTAHLPQRSFHVTGLPTLVIKNDTGSVQIHTSDTPGVTINATEHTGYFDNFDDLDVTMTQNANEIDAIVSDNRGNRDVDLDIVLPSTSTLQATINTGSFDVTGVSGQMNLTTHTGSIEVKGGTVSGNSSFKSDTGNITFENDTLSGQTLFSTQTGTISFDGGLTPQGNYTFQNTTGSVDLTLPASSSFKLDVSSHGGSVNNGFGSAVVGSDPTSTLHIQTGLGSVTLHKK